MASAGCMWWIRASGESASAGRDRVLTLSLEEYIRKEKGHGPWRGSSKASGITSNDSALEVLLP